jgi:hypothetical protein
MRAPELICLHEDATTLGLTTLVRLALVRDRAARIRGIRRDLVRTGVTDLIGQDSVGANREPVVNACCDRAK